MTEWSVSYPGERLRGGLGECGRPLVGLGDPDGGHAGGGGGLDADVGVLEDEAGGWFDAEALGGEEEGVGGGLGVGVVAGADEGVEEVEDAQSFQ